LGVCAEGVCIKPISLSLDKAAIHFKFKHVFWARSQKRYVVADIVAEVDGRVSVDFQSKVKLVYDSLIIKLRDVGEIRHRDRIIDNVADLSHI